MTKSTTPPSAPAVKLARLKRQYQELKKKGDVRGVLRVKALIAYYEGNPEKTVARCYGVSVKSLRRWLKRSARALSLADAARSGRPPELTPEQQVELKTILREQKQRVWTARHVYVLLLTTFGVAYEVKYIPELLRSLGLSYQKAVHVLYRQNRQQRRAWLEKTLPALYKKQLADGWRLFYQDEVGFQTDGTLMYSWGLQGEPIEIPNYGVRGRVNLIGALELGTGVFYGVLTRFEVTAMRFRRFVCHLKREMRTDKIILICDNAKFHKADWLLKWVHQQQAWLQVAFLPAYSPDFNPIERFWRWLKGEYTHNHCWDSTAALQQHLTGMLAELPQRVGEFLGVMRKEVQRLGRCVLDYFWRRVTLWVYQPAAFGRYPDCVRGGATA